MKIINKKVSELIPYINNARKHSEKQVKQIASSIKEFGFNVPILIDKDNGVIAGHGRIQAAELLKITDVPTVCLDHLTDTQKKAFILADNKLVLNGEWDEDILKLELESLQDLDFDVTLTGFDLEEMDDMFPPEPGEGLTDEDAIPEDVEPICQAGDLWQLGEHRLLCGDSTKEEDVARLMDGAKADMVFTDPPYGVNYSKKNKEIFGAKEYTEIKNDNMSVADTAKVLWSPVFKMLYNSSKDDASIYATMPQGGDQMMMMMMMMQESWQVKHELIWVKEAPVFSMGRLDYDYKHEPIAYGWKKKHNFYGKGKFTKSIWEIKRDGKKQHPTMKPIELIENALLNSTLSNQLVIDFFLGSGSTLIAAEKTGRKCYGMELDQHYCDVIIKRWEDFTGKKAVKID